MFDDVSAEDLARSYKSECNTNAGTVDGRLYQCSTRFQEFALYIQNLKGILDTLPTVQAAAETAAGLFNDGAYKDGITNFAEDLNSNASLISETTESLNQLLENVTTYTTALAEYMDNLTTLKNLWSSAYEYYTNHKEEIEGW